VRKAILLVVALFVAAQFVPVERTNPPAAGEIELPPEVGALAERACYDCHSHETVWPWYAEVAPVSWLAVRDVGEAREHLNFSTWADYADEERRELLEEIAEEVEDGDMPLRFYLPFHPKARLSEEERRVLVSWARRAEP
jgi:hypothetical protein